MTRTHTHTHTHAHLTSYLFLGEVVIEMHMNTLKRVRKPLAPLKGVVAIISIPSSRILPMGSVVLNSLH